MGRDRYQSVQVVGGLACLYIRFVVRPFSHEDGSVAMAGRRQRNNLKPLAWRARPSVFFG